MMAAGYFAVWAVDVKVSSARAVGIVTLCHTGGKGADKRMAIARRLTPGTAKQGPRHCRPAMNIFRGEKFVPTRFVLSLHRTRATERNSREAVFDKVI